VVKPRNGFSVALPLDTQADHGTTTSGTSNTSTAVLPVGASLESRTDRDQLTREPIYIKIENESVSIDPTALIDLAKPYTVSHDIKVQNIGRVFGDSVGHLDKYFAESLGHTKE